MKKGKVYTIIVTYNGMQWIDMCLKSLAGQSEIIVVDNNSTDNTLDHIENYFPDIIILKQSNNLGFGQANNIGISYAITQGAAYVFLLNQDAYATKDCIRNLQKVMEGINDCGVVSPTHFNGKGSGLDRYFEFCAKKNPAYYEHNLEIQLFKVPMVNAAAWFIPVSIIEAIGGFDPLFYHYGEDHNFCQRLKYHGFQLYVASSIIIRHDREDRIKHPVDLFSDAYYLKYEKQLKINNADINVHNIKGICRNQKTKYLKHIVKEVLRLNFKAIKGYFKQYRMIAPLFEAILTSRETNVRKGTHYLNSYSS